MTPRVTPAFAYIFFFIIFQTKNAVYIFFPQTTTWTQMYAKDVKLKVLHALKSFSMSWMKRLWNGTIKIWVQMYNCQLMFLRKGTVVAATTVSIYIFQVVIL